MVRRWHAELAWIGYVARRVLIEVENGRIAAVTEDADPTPDAIPLAGFTVPGLANAHSHALQRALRGRTHASAADFWLWRRLMYQLADALDPESYYELARATYAEMALAGITAVGEFHYLHHDVGGARYAEPNAMGEALIRAASDAGIRITLIDTCYLWAGLDNRPLKAAQRRFGDGSAEAWAERADGLNAGDRVRVGAGIHSVRAVDTDAMEVVRDWAAARGTPLHLHVSEQRQENEMCLSATGYTPTQLLSSVGVLGPGTTAVHATHLDQTDIDLLGSSETCACICPTTERDLGDGIGPARAIAAAGSPLAVGSDMHAVIDLFEEARAVELDERLVAGTRGLHHPEDLLATATTDGMRALGWEGQGLAVGGLADFTTVATTSPRMAGAADDNIVQHLIFTATSGDVTSVVVGGTPIVEHGRHLQVDDVGVALSRAIARVT